MKYTKEQIRFILNNYINNEDLCVKETGHTLSSIKLMLQNIGYKYGLVKNFSEGNPLYTEVADEYRVDNPRFGEPMREEVFCKKFGIIK